VAERADREAFVLRALVVASAAALVLAVALPLGEVLRQSVLDRSGMRFVGAANFVAYFSAPGMAASFRNSLFAALLSTLICVPLAFACAWALTRTNMPGKRLVRTAAMLPVFAPSLVPAIGLVYLFGNKGLVTTGFFGVLPGVDIGLYGMTGIVMGEVVHGLPHAVLILTATLALADARLYEAAEVLGATPLRRLWTVTLPGARYGLLSAGFVCFTLAVTDFGVPKVVGGNTSVLATEVYKQVIGQQNLVMGATAGVLLLVPCVLGFVLDRLVRRRQAAVLGTQIVPLRPVRRPLRDVLALGMCLAVVLPVVGLFAVALYASVVRMWPYDLSLSLIHYQFERVGIDGLGPWWNSVRLAAYSALLGTAAAFGTAWLCEKTPVLGPVRRLLQFLSMVPVALPGIVLGLAYIFFFAPVGRPWSALYGTAALVVLSNVVHFHTVGFLTASAALRRLDPELETVSASLGVPLWRLLRRVTLPMTLPAITETASYYFVSSMVTVSAVIFLYPPELPLASVSVVQLDDAGDTASAAAMSMLIVATSITVSLGLALASHPARARARAWTGAGP
jgi:iron(III) transport system permease protein